MTKKKYPSKGKHAIQKALADCRKNPKMTKFQKALLLHLDAIVDVLTDLRFIANSGHDNHFDK